MKTLFSELNSRAVSEGWVKVSNEHGMVAARFISGRLAAFYYKSRHAQ